MSILMIAALGVLGLEEGRPPELVRPEERAAYSARLTDTVRALAESRAGGPCPAAATSESTALLKIGTASTVLMAKADSPVDPAAPVFKERVQVTGCGPKTGVDNIIVVRLKAGGWLMAPVLPGESITSPTLGRDAMLTSVQAAVQGGSCADAAKTFVVTDTVVLERPSAPGGAWRERWTQQFCGADRSVIMSFTPDSTGTGFGAEPDWPGHP